MDIAAVQRRYTRAFDAHRSASGRRRRARNGARRVAGDPACRRRRPGPRRSGRNQAANLSRAYRVNLTMLAAMALLTGGFLVFSAQALSVGAPAQRVSPFSAPSASPAAACSSGSSARRWSDSSAGMVGAALGHALA